MEANTKIRVRFEIGEIKFEAEGPADLVERERSVFTNTLLPSAVEAIVRTRGTEQAMKYVEPVEQPKVLPLSNATPLSENAIPLTEESKDLSRTRYIAQFGQIGEQDFALISAYYDEKKNGNTSFTSDNVKQYYNDARRNKFSNVSVLLGKLAQKGLIMDDPNAERKTPKAYILTSQGIDYVENYSPKEETEKKHTKARKPRKKAESEYGGINVDSLNLKNYPEVKSLKDFKEKMMTILYIITNEKAGEWFTTTDVLCLMTDIFGEAATKDQVNGVFKREKLWFKAGNVDGSNREVKRKLLNKGIEYAQSLVGGTEQSVSQ